MNDDDDIGQVSFRLASIGGVYPGDIAELESWLKKNGLTNDEVAIIKEEIERLGANIDWKACEKSLRNIVQETYSAGSNELELLRSLCVFECL